MAQVTYALTITWNNDGQFAQSVFKYQFDDIGFSDASTAALALITAFQTNKLAHVLALCPTSVLALSIKARAIDSVGGFEAVTVLPGGSAGTRIGSQQVSGVCPVVVFFPSGNAKARGKWFIPGVTDGDLIDGFFQSSFNTACNTHLNAFITDMVLVGGGAPTAKFIIRQTKPTVSALSVQYWMLNPVPGTLRKRQRPV